MQVKPIRLCGGGTAQATEEESSRPAKSCTPENWKGTEDRCGGCPPADKSRAPLVALLGDNSAGRLIAPQDTFLPEKGLSDFVSNTCSFSAVAWTAASTCLRARE